MFTLKLGSYFITNDRATVLRFRTPGEIRTSRSSSLHLPQSPAYFCSWGVGFHGPPIIVWTPDHWASKNICRRRDRNPRCHIPHSFWRALSAFWTFSLLRNVTASNAHANGLDQRFHRIPVTNLASNFAEKPEDSTSPYDRISVRLPDPSDFGPS
jgi:hypothetical protein